MADVDPLQDRLRRIEHALEEQRRYIRRVPDPDNRYRAETNLLTLLEMRDAMLSKTSASSHREHSH